MNLDISSLFNITSNSQILVGILSVVFAIFVLVSIVLYYHWRTYTEKGKMIILIEFVYLTGGALLFSSALVLISVM